MTNEELFHKNGYCIVKNVISNELRDFVTQYVLFDEMQNFNGGTHGDRLLSRPHTKYADPAMETILLHLHDTMQKNTGLQLFPTYSYYRIYRPGDKLRVHTDRPSCEISCTLCFNHSYNKEDFSWPIFIDGNKVVLEPGDMVIYKGYELKHWREMLNLNDESAWHFQGFFHYVNANGPYSEFKYDKRATIGEGMNNQIYKPYIQYL